MSFHVFDNMKCSDDCGESNVILQKQKVYIIGVLLSVNKIFHCAHLLKNNLRKTLLFTPNLLPLLASKPKRRACPSLRKTKH